MVLKPMIHIVEHKKQIRKLAICIQLTKCFIVINIQYDKLLAYNLLLKKALYLFC